MLQAIEAVTSKGNAATVAHIRKGLARKGMSAGKMILWNQLRKDCNVLGFSFDTLPLALSFRAGVVGHIQEFFKVDKKEKLPKERSRYSESELPKFSEIKDTYSDSSPRKSGSGADAFDLNAISTGYTSPTPIMSSGHSVQFYQFIAESSYPSLLRYLRYIITAEN